MHTPMPPRAKSKTSSDPGSDPVPVYALIGADPFLQGEALREILEAMPEDVQRADLDGATIEPADVFDELRSFAMFGGSRVVVVRDAEQFITKHRESVENYLAEPSTQNVLVLRCASLPKNQKVYKLADKAGQIVVCEPPKQNQLPKWLIDRARTAHNLKLDSAAANLLADLIGVDLGSLDNELAKLALATPTSNDGRVTADLISGGVAFRREQQMWTLTDALTRGDVAGALTIWRQLLATDDSAEFRAVTWLGLWLEKAGGALRMKRQGRRPFDIAKEMKIWPAQNVEPLLRTAETLGPRGIREATDALAELDFRTKTGLGDAKRAAERFIVSVCAA